MRYTTASVAAAVLLLLVIAAFWPETRTAPRAPQATAQEAAPPKEATTAIPTISSKEENNIRVEKLLASHRMKVDIEEMPLKKFATDFLQKVTTEDGKTAEFQVFIDHKTLEEAGVHRDTPFTLHFASLRLDMMLDLVLNPMGLGYYVEDGIIIFTSKEAVATRMEVRVYNCRDLLQLPRVSPRPASKAAGGGPPGASPPDGASGATPVAGESRRDVDLIDVLLTNVKPDAWIEAGGPGRVVEYRGILVVTQTIEAHRQIDQVLEMLRQTTAKDRPSRE